MFGLVMKVSPEVSRRRSAMKELLAWGLEMMVSKVKLSAATSSWRQIAWQSLSYRDCGGDGQSFVGRELGVGSAFPAEMIQIVVVIADRGKSRYHRRRSSWVVVTVDLWLWWVVRWWWGEDDGDGGSWRLLMAWRSEAEDGGRSEICCWRKPELL